MRANFQLLLLSAFALVAFRAVNSYKIAIFTPNIAASQVMFGVRVAETLVEAGHDVTIILLNIKKEKKAKSYTKLVKVMPVDVFSITEEEMSDEHFVFKDADFSRFRAFLKRMFGSMEKYCEKLVKDREFLERLKAEKFDLAFTHMFDLCTIGVVHYVQIPSWIWLNSGQIMDYVAHYVGVPTPPSYIPPMISDMPDAMSFVQRIKSFVGRTLVVPLYEYMLVNPQTELFRKHLDADFPHLSELASRSPLVMVNTNEMYSQARPTLHKIINIGGIGMKFEEPKPFQPELKKIVDNTENVVIMTFGSHANLSAMPDEWKEALMNSFRKFPDHEFIIRYLAHDWDEKKPKNVHFSTWIPQTDLLQHKKTRLLITHGGFNSVQEAINAGVPLIVIPLFGDQFANARLVSRNGIGRILTKSQVNEEFVTDLLGDILHNDRYAKAVVRLQQMIAKHPESAEERLVRWTEFAAEFQTLDNLTPYGTQLNFFVYHSLDVIAALLALVVLLHFILFAILYCVTLPCRSKKDDKKKKKKKE